MQGTGSPSSPVRGRCVITEAILQCRKCGIRPVNGTLLAITHALPAYLLATT